MSVHSTNTVEKFYRDEREVLATRGEIPIKGMEHRHSRCSSMSMSREDYSEDESYGLDMAAEFGYMTVKSSNSSSFATARSSMESLENEDSYLEEHRPLPIVDMSRDSRKCAQIPGVDSDSLLFLNTHQAYSRVKDEIRKRPHSASLATRREEENGCNEFRRLIVINGSSPHFLYKDGILRDALENVPTQIVTCSTEALSDYIQNMITSCSKEIEAEELQDKTSVYFKQFGAGAKNSIQGSAKSIWSEDTLIKCETQASSSFQPITSISDPILCRMKQNPPSKESASFYAFSRKVDSTENKRASSSHPTTSISSSISDPVLLIRVRQNPPLKKSASIDTFRNLPLDTHPSSFLRSALAYTTPHYCSFDAPCSGGREMQFTPAISKHRNRSLFSFSPRSNIMLNPYFLFTDEVYTSLRQSLYYGSTPKFNLCTPTRRRLLHSSSSGTLKAISSPSLEERTIGECVSHFSFALWSHCINCIVLCTSPPRIYLSVNTDCSL